jgi:hypothetical protein
MTQGIGHYPAFVVLDSDTIFTTIRRMTRTETMRSFEGSTTRFNTQFDDVA